MSFWKNLFGSSKKETQIIEEPEHELSVAPPDDLMVVEDKNKEDKSKQEESNVSEDKKYNINNKDSP